MAPVATTTRCVKTLVAALFAGAALAPSAAAWLPESARYGLGTQTNLPVTMSDGTVLRANVYYPTDPSTGTAASPASRPAETKPTTRPTGQPATP
jgi:predicted acyl esterase